MAFKFFVAHFFKKCLVFMFLGVTSVMPFCAELSSLHRQELPPENDDYRRGHNYISYTYSDGRLREEAQQERDLDNETFQHLAPLVLVYGAEKVLNAVIANDDEDALRHLLSFLDIKWTCITRSSHPIHLAFRKAILHERTHLLPLFAKWTGMSKLSHFERGLFDVSFYLDNITHTPKAGLKIINHAVALIKKYPLNIHDAPWCFLLSIAANAGSLEAVNILLEKGFRLTKDRGDQATAFETAIIRGYDNIALLLINNYYENALQMEGNAYARQALEEYVRKGFTDTICKKLLQEKMSETLDFLLDHNAFPGLGRIIEANTTFYGSNKPETFDAYTSLDYAAYSGQLTTCKKLLPYFGRLQKTKKRETWAEMTKRLGCGLWRCLRRHPRPTSTPLHWACAGGYMPTIDYFLDIYSVHHRDSLRRTPLHFAVRQGSPNSINMLLARGAIKDIDRPDARGETPLSLSINSTVEIFKLTAQTYVDSFENKVDGAFALVEKIKTFDLTLDKNMGYPVGIFIGVYEVLKENLGHREAKKELKKLLTKEPESETQYRAIDHIVILRGKRGLIELSRILGDDFVKMLRAAIKNMKPKNFPKKEGALELLEVLRELNQLELLFDDISEHSLFAAVKKAQWPFVSNIAFPTVFKRWTRRHTLDGYDILLNDTNIFEDDETFIEMMQHLAYAESSRLWYRAARYSVSEEVVRKTLEKEPCRGLLDRPFTAAKYGFALSLFEMWRGLRFRRDLTRALLPKHSLHYSDVCEDRQRQAAEALDELIIKWLKTYAADEFYKNSIQEAYDKKKREVFTDIMEDRRPSELARLFANGVDPN